MWVAILEKAWAKVKGSYADAQGGFMANGFRSMTGVPVFAFDMSTITTQTAADTFWNDLKAADDAGYYLGGGTRGSGNTENSCGTID